AAEHRQVGLASISVEQPLERLLEGPGSEVVELGAALGCECQRFEIERRCVDADAPQCAAARIQCADRGADAALGDIHRYFEGFATIRAALSPSRFGPANGNPEK